MSRSKDRLKNMTTSSLCVALLCACSFVVIPLPFTPVVLTMHTVVVNLVALVTTPKQSFFIMLTYLFMGLVGLPVFSGGTAGPDKLFGPTGGFYFGFLISVVVVSLLKGKRVSFWRYFLLCLGISIPVQHLFAVLFMCFYNNFNVFAAFVSVSLPFLAGDAVKAVVSAFVGVELVKILNKRT